MGSAKLNESSIASRVGGSSSDASEAELREELAELRAQFNEVLVALKDVSRHKKDEVASRLSSTIDRSQEKINDKMSDLYEAGNAGIDEMSDQVKRNPVTSLLVAFGVGYLVSRLSRRH